MVNPNGNGAGQGYQRYHVETREAPDLFPWPNRFNVQVGKVGLAKHLLTEMLHTRFDMEVATSRPCMYGVFSGPVGGFAPRPKFCVGCLRCTTEFPDFVVVQPNPERRALGDSYFTFRHVEAVTYEAESGRVPVKGAGYRGQFGGQDWDGMWTDMSEIVRPTRDGIHGREFISTSVDIGSKPGHLLFDDRGQPTGPLPRTFSLPVPFLFDRLHASLATPDLYKLLAQAAQAVQTLQVIPLDLILDFNLRGEWIVPLVSSTNAGRLSLLPYPPLIVELEVWDAALLDEIRRAWPEAVVSLRTPFVSVEELLGYFERGVSVFHLTADYHGRSPQGEFIFDLIREAHMAFVSAGCRDQVTLIGSGGIVAAEHVPKAIIAGLDVIALDLPLLVALQARLEGEFTGREGGALWLPRRIPVEWGVQRIKTWLPPGATSCWRCWAPWACAKCAACAARWAGLYSWLSWRARRSREFEGYDG